MRFDGLLRAGVLGAGLILSGCASTYGANSVSPAQFDYNSAIVSSANEQLLLNIVRLRYSDTTTFLEVQSVVSQYVYSTRPSAGVTFGGDTVPEIGSVGVSGIIEERPTVTYAPQRGAEYARRMLVPVRASIIFLLSRAGWSSERLMVCCVAQFGDLVNARATLDSAPTILPTNAEYRAAAARMFQAGQAGLLPASFETVPGRDGEPVPSVVFHFSAVDAAPDGVRDEYARLLDQLGVGAQGGPYLMTEIRRDELDMDQVLLIGRSPLGILYALGHAVEAPPEHLAAGLVQEPRDTLGNPADWEQALGGMFSVHYSREEPEHAYVKIFYRDYWFYVPDNDLESKATFNLVSQLLDLQSADAEGVNLPVFTITSGG